MDITASTSHGLFLYVGFYQDCPDFNFSLNRFILIAVINFTDQATLLFLGFYAYLAD